MSEKAITVYDIAREAGVSPATVSRVLTNNARVSEEKKQRIEEIIKKYDFEPNGLARSLSKQETKTIGMIVPDIRNPYFSNIFIECEMLAAQYGYNMILCNTMNNLSAEMDHLKNLCEKHVDAIIQVGGNADEISPNEEYVKLINKTAKKMPVVVGGEFPGAECYKVYTEKEHGMGELIDYLIQCGHKKIALVGGRDSVIPTVRKRESLKHYLKLHDLELNPSFIIDCNYDIEGGYEAMHKLLESGEMPGAIIGINDQVAIGVLKTCLKQKLKIPSSISLVAFDDTYFSEIATPQLTSVNYNLKMHSEKMMTTVIDILSGNETEKIKTVETFLTIRDSCQNISIKAENLIMR